jgi:hypothetical protein
VIRFRNKLRRSLAMTLEVARLSSEDDPMTPEAVDAVASSFDCDTRTVRHACNSWLFESAKFRQVLTQYRADVEKNA